jgi:hypothetical protein
MRIRCLSSMILAVALFVSTVAGMAAKKGAPPSAQDIANAKSQGLVWVDTAAKVYYKDGDFYGKTKSGKFITQDAAEKEGFRKAAVTEKKTYTKKQPDQSGIDASIETHASTPPKP